MLTPINRQTGINKKALYAYKGRPKARARAIGTRVQQNSWKL
jgi:hypothetical protein